MSSGLQAWTWRWVLSLPSLELEPHQGFFQLSSVHIFGLVNFHDHVSQFLIKKNGKHTPKGWTGTLSVLFLWRRLTFSVCSGCCNKNKMGGSYIQTHFSQFWKLGSTNPGAGRLFLVRAHLLVHRRHFLTAPSHGWRGCPYRVSFLWALGLFRKGPSCELEPKGPLLLRVEISRYIFWWDTNIQSI